MLCANCGSTCKGVVCVACRTKRTRIGMLLHQRRFLETWLAGEIDLRIRNKNGAAHIELFDDRWHTYCDIDLYDVDPEPFRLRTIPVDVCPNCTAVMNQLIAQYHLQPGGPA